MLDQDQVCINVTLHEVDFVALLTAARLLGCRRDDLIRRAIASYLLSLQKSGVDLGIQLPSAPSEVVNKKEEVSHARPERGKDQRE